MIQGVASVAKIVNELKNLFVGLNWDWKVKQLNEKEYLITFPSEEVRSKISTCKSFDFDTCAIKASVVEIGMTEEAIDELAVVWVKIFGVPKIARTEESIKATVELIGEFEAIDLNSLRRDEPVRVRVACKDPRELYFSIHIYINKVGYLVRWEPEGYPPYENKQYPPDGGDDDEDRSDDGNEDMNVDDEFKEKSPSRGRQTQEKRAGGKGFKGAQSALPAYKGKSHMLDISPVRPKKKIASKKQSLLSNKERSCEEKTLIIWEDVKAAPVIEHESQEIDIPLSGQLSQFREDSERLEGSEESLLSHNEELEKCDIPSLSDIERLREEEEVEEEQSFKEVSTKKKTRKSGEPAVSSRMSLRHRDLAAIPIPRELRLWHKGRTLKPQVIPIPLLSFS